MPTEYTFDNKVAIVTGGALGIGRAIGKALAAAGARVAVVDIDGDAAQRVADAIGGVAFVTDVSDDNAMAELVTAVTDKIGPVDIFVSNAGVGSGDGPAGAALVPLENWHRNLGVNLMAHVYAARHVVPAMLERGGGVIVNVASAAGLLSQIGDAAYSASKHAAVAFAESLAIEYGDAGLRVSVVCPQAVATRMIGFDEDSGETPDGFGGNDVDGILTPAQVASAVMDGVRDGRFLILPHPQVSTYFQRKASDHDRWIGGMRRFRQKLLDARDK